MTNRCGILCVLHVILTCHMVWPHTGAGFGLYQAEAKHKDRTCTKSMQECYCGASSKIQTLSYIVDTCLLPEYIIVGLFSGLFFPFFLFIWYFGFLDF